MAPESGTVNSNLAASLVGEKLRREPFRFEFFQAVCLLEKFFPERKPVGAFEHPAKEIARFGVHTSLAFPASEIQAMQWPETGPPRVSVNFMGLTGFEGALPNPYTSLIIERLRASDTSLLDFLDIFNHRILSLFYAAWAKYRFEIAGESGERNNLSRDLLSLVGLGTDCLQDRLAVPDNLLVYYSGLLAQRPRSAQALGQILADYFELPVEVKQFEGGWYRLEPDTQSSLSESRSQSDQLGFGAVAGDAVWNQQSRVRINLGPLDLEKYVSFLPGGSRWEPLQAWIRFFSNQELDFEVKLILKRDQVPACELGAEEMSGPRLGWVSWMRNRPLGRDPDDTTLMMETAEGGQP